jgi:RNA polymerase sigma-70 factor, ECF subfamily
LSSSGDKAEAFLALLLPLQRQLAVYCRRMLRDPSIVEDVLQTAIAEAFARFDRYADGTNFRAWIFRFVTLEIFNQNRRREPVASSDVADVPAPLEIVSQLAAESLLAEPGAVMEQFEEHVAEALLRLTASERATLLLRALGDLSYHEIQQILAIPVGSVMGYLSRARHKMRQLLAEHAPPCGVSPPANELKS